MTTGELVDGMKLDERGNIYVTGPKGVWIISPEGEHLGMIQVPENVGNVNWGGDDWQTLFIPASTSVYSIRLKVGGNRLGYMHYNDEEDERGRDRPQARGPGHPGPAERRDHRGRRLRRLGRPCARDEPERGRERAAASPRPAARPASR